MELAGHIKVLGGPHVARGPDVAQACLKPNNLNKVFAKLSLTKFLIRTVPCTVIIFLFGFSFM